MILLGVEQLCSSCLRCTVVSPPEVSQSPLRAQSKLSEEPPQHITQPSQSIHYNSNDSCSLGAAVVENDDHAIPPSTNRCREVRGRVWDIVGTVWEDCWAIIMGSC